MFSIKYLIPLFVLILALGEESYFYFSSSKILTEDIQERHLSRLKEKMTSTQENVEYLIRTNNFEKIKERISAMGSDLHLIEIILLNDQGTIDASLHIAHIGGTLEEDLSHKRSHMSTGFKEYLIKTINNSKNNKKYFVEHQKAYQKILGIYPINYGTDAKNAFLNKEGQLIIIEDVSYIENEIEEQLNKQFFPLMLFMLFSTFILALVLYFAVIHRLNKLDEQSILYTQGDTDVRFHVSGNDEISHLAATFNNMIQSIESQKKTNAEDRKYLSLTLDSIGDGVIATDITGNITRINPTALKLTGYSYDEAIGKQRRDIFKVSLHKTQEKSTSTDRNDKALQSKQYFILTSKDNQKYHISKSSSSIISQEGERIGLIFVFRDITQEHMVQDELRTYRHNLESLVNARTKELENSIIELTSAKNKLVESEKMASLGSLVAGISHEINTPLGLSYTGITHIQALTEDVEKMMETKTLTHSALISYIEDINLMSKSMSISLLKATELIRSFKQIAVDQHAENLRQFNLSTYIDDVLLSLQSSMKHTNIQLSSKISPDITLFSYPGIFSQIITNFINNAVMHAFDKNKDKENIIMIYATKENDILSLIFEDNGKGMNEDVIKHIFDPFFTTKLGQGGSGLGMHIVYNLVTQKLHGEIQCLSTLEKGTTFIITVPIKEKDV